MDEETSRKDKAQEQLEASSKVLLKVRSGIEHLSEKLKHLKAVSRSWMITDRHLFIYQFSLSFDMGLFFRVQNAGADLGVGAKRQIVTALVGTPNFFLNKGLVTLDMSLFQNASAILSVHVRGNKSASAKSFNFQCKILILRYTTHNSSILWYCDGKVDCYGLNVLTFWALQFLFGTVKF